MRSRRIRSSAATVGAVYVLTLSPSPCVWPIMLLVGHTNLGRAGGGGKQLIYGGTEGIRQFLGYGDTRLFFAIFYV